MESLLYNLLDELLFIFSTEYFAVCAAHVLTLDRGSFQISLLACVRPLRIGF